MACGKKRPWLSTRRYLHVNTNNTRAQGACFRKKCGHRYKPYAPTPASWNPGTFLDLRPIEGRRWAAWFWGVVVCVFYLPGSNGATELFCSLGGPFEDFLFSGFF